MHSHTYVDRKKYMLEVEDGLTLVLHMREYSEYVLKTFAILLFNDYHNYSVRNDRVGSGLHALLLAYILHGQIYTTLATSCIGK